MILRTGLLAVPSFDERTLTDVRALLARTLPGCVVIAETAIGMQRAWIAETLRRWCDEEELDLVVTIGGTLPAPGPSSAECVPEATLEVIERLLPGLPEAMRAEGQAQSPLALLDRGVAGIRSRTLILNLPEGEAAPIFLSAVIEVIPPIAAHLHAAPDAPRLAALGAAGEDEMVTARTSVRKELNADEFAAFLGRAHPSD